ncbi:hypothetical protein HS041_05945 [Planomonospora sp. ID67723]|uniref:hypothetical protein n=1 Tax=Planomonospora sp. ID67723 TaxID=2738134 RepID=UPI0018C3DBDF|nr:hypothetical protein [Planomonospora sp. ID67723]MBG0827302.1 hypothetical protein [Planomonospora sp. ID67723]
MSNASKNIREVLATVTLTTLAAGAGWAATGPAALADGASRAVSASAALAAGAGLSRDGVPSVAERLAHLADLRGLSRASAVISMADAGGVAAGIGFPALPFGLPGYPGLTGVEILSPIPDLPGLPGLPGPRALFRSGVPSVPALRDAAGVMSTGTVLSLPAPRSAPRPSARPVPRPVVREGEVRPAPPASTAMPKQETEQPPRPVLGRVLPDLPLG